MALVTLAVSIATAVVSTSSPARAADGGNGLKLELGLTGGVHFFADDLELGVDDDRTLPHPKTSGLFGLRASLALASFPTLALEIEGVGIPTADSKHNYRMFIVGWRAHLLANLAMGRLLDGKLVPFVLAGAGAFSVVSTEGTEYDEIKKDTDAEVHAGVGAKYAVTPLVGLRLDLRAMLVPNTTNNGVSPDFEIMGGVFVALGGAPPPPHAAAPPPAPVADADHDGIADNVDACPTEAEDKDGFKDDDGCPDPDNDGDGIADARDKCPNEPETKNGIDDDDGCPEDDKDGDGIVGSRDKCPTEAEDKDGFEDDDGCPDPDNDKDGVADATDKCPNEPETKNGYQDEDGCPDQVPAAVAKFTGVIKGITFRKNSADITPSSFPTLKQAVQVMKSYPALRLEVSGHTSDEGTRDFNMKLSQQRAEAVKAYLVSVGAETYRVTTVGFGPDKPIADNKEKAGREKNRRIEFRLLSQDEEGAPGKAPDKAPDKAPEKMGAPPADGGGAGNGAMKPMGEPAPAAPAAAKPAADKKDTKLDTTKDTTKDTKKGAKKNATPASP